MFKQFKNHFNQKIKADFQSIVLSFLHNLKINYSLLSTFLKTKTPRFHTFLFTIFIKHKWKTRIIGSIFLIWYLFFSLPSPLFNDPTSMVLEDRNGYLLGAKIAKDGQWRFPQSDSLPNKFAQSIIAFEDKRFYRHLGIDPRGIARAFQQNIRNRSVVSGGSTISMQVIRLSRKGKSRSVWQKIIEMIKATRLELKFSKQKILSFYASNAPFGGNVVGLDAASWRYFGKQPKLLSWGEAATLAVLPNAPALIHPGRNRDALFAKRNRLLDRLLENGTLDSLTWNLSKIEPLPEAPLPLPRLAPHLLDRVQLEHFTNVKKGTKTKLNTTINRHLQIQVNNILNKHHLHLAANGIHNMAAIVLDVETGETLVYIGNVYGNHNKEHGHEVDVIRAPRSTGSILKPFLYASMIHEGEILPTTLIPDIPTQMKNYRPLNFNETFDGAVPANRALARSLNIPFVRMLSDYGLEKFHFKLKKLGLSTITKSANHYGLPLVLGGAEGNLWEITGVYASMARTLNHFYDDNGFYQTTDFRPPSYLPVTIPTKKKLVKEAPVLSSSSIWATFNAMLEVQRPTEDGAWELYQSRRRIAWKTGTSFGFRDAWAVGVNSKYAVGVWVGNGDGEGRPGLVGVLAAAPVLFDIFNRFDAPKWFDTPYDELTEIPVCKISGYRASDICETIDTIEVPTSGLKSLDCPFHKVIHLDSTVSFRVHGDCESPSNMTLQSWFVLPPVEEYYYKSKNPNYKILPPYRKDCLSSISTNNKPMQMIYPRPSSKIYVPIDLGGESGKTVFKVAHRNPTTMIYWHIDNEFIGTTETFHEIAVNPSVGKHQLTLVDENGAMLELNFESLGK